jgi:hypothetical protein
VACRRRALDSGVGAITVAKAYRLLKAILNTAVDDGLIRRNPCRITGAGQEKSPERPVLSLRQVFDLADAFTDRRYRLLILLAVFCGLRWGELAALRRKHIDISAGLIRVEATVAELTTGALVTGPPKSLAVSAGSPSRLSCWPTSPSTWTTSPALLPRALSLSARKVPSSAAATSRAHGAQRSRWPGSSASTSTIFGIPGTPWPPRLVRACANSWTGWATAQQPVPPTSTSIARRCATR